MREGTKEYNGILLIDKPAGFTSFDVVAKMRGIAKTRRIGHSGTLDPMATGVLPLFFGRATKACDIMPRQDKRYSALFRLGLTTDTQDITGTVTSRSDVYTSPEKVIETAARFIGDSLQIPPMYSAVKINGRKLYELARQGVEVDRKARPITVFSLHCAVSDEQQHLYSLDVHCSKGVYIRTLVADIGEMLGCGAVLTCLRRTQAGAFQINDCITLERAAELADAGNLEEAMLPLGQAFDGLAQAFPSDKQARMLQNGVRLDPARVRRQAGDGPFAVYMPDGTFLGVGETGDKGFYLTKLFALEVRDGCKS